MLDVEGRYPTPEEIEVEGNEWFFVWLPKIPDSRSFAECPTVSRFRQVFLPYQACQDFWPQNKWADVEEMLEREMKEATDVNVKVHYADCLMRFGANRMRATTAFHRAKEIVTFSVDPETQEVFVSHIDPVSDAASR